MLQVLADGLVIGSVISLGAIGLTVTFSILRFANFGHGELLAWGSYLALSALAMFAAVGLAEGPRPLAPFSFGWPLIAALVVAALFTALLALALDGILFRRLYGGIPRYYSDELQIAVALVPRSVWGGMRITPDQMFVIGLTMVSVVVLHLFLKRSTLGRAMRATADNPQLARVAGIDPERMLRAAWVLGVILGGIGSVWGAVLGGLIVGLAESAAVAVVGAEWRAAAAFVVLIAMLLLKPTGLFGDRP